MEKKQYYIEPQMKIQEFVINTLLCGSVGLNSGNYDKTKDTLLGREDEDYDW